MNHDEDEPETQELHYRVTLDFRMLARAITPEVCRESCFFNDEKREADDEEFQENIERQRRLYKLLRNNRLLFEQYLLSVFAQEAGNLVYEGLPNAFDIKDENEILAPLYRSMGEEDVQFYDECRKLGGLEANMELIGRAFKVEWVGVEVEELSRRITGEVKRAEIVERTKIRMIRKLNFA